MKEIWRPTLPFTLLPMGIGVVYLLTYAVDYVAMSLGATPPAAENNWRPALLTIAAICHAGYRVIIFHPFYNTQYRKWLAITPWSYKTPLPQGPAHLIWTDALTMAGMCVVAWADAREFTYLPAMAFMATYLVLVNLTFERRLRRYTVAALLIAPLAIYPYNTAVAAFAVFGGLYILVLFGLHEYFMDFPWNTDYWTGNLVLEMKKNSLRQNIIGWPFKFLRVFETSGVSMKASLVVASLATWWAHVLFRLSDSDAVCMLMPMGGFYLAAIRMGVYIAMHRSPISIFGRITTGRLIVPRHDKILIAPLCVLLAGTALPLGLYRAGVGLSWVLDGSVFLTVFLAFAMGPTLKDWQLTGAHRASRIAQAIRSKTPPNSRMLEFIMDRLRTGEA